MKIRLHNIYTPLQQQFFFIPLLTPNRTNNNNIAYKNLYFFQQQQRYQRNINLFNINNIQPTKFQVKERREARP
ncbi:hypothetical protein Syun_023370 [Stephania yunnanensis]|uniref:Uncharacterized protein n=1 Tax=Stephania yunnanensis TaxID=152371 RepID=A0AAP0F9I7_9MAGN